MGQIARRVAWLKRWVVFFFLIKKINLAEVKIDANFPKHPSTSMEYRVDAPRFPWISKTIESDRGKCAILFYPKIFKKPKKLLFTFFFLFLISRMWEVGDENRAKFTVLAKKIYSLENKINF